ncbi:MAG: PilZ domain-containing protein [Gammaproteobacteria bacterium]|nr:PilZ domain-containing protein [Gammaproteobacteria bacterium]MDD9895442.1 PilZ domain-containing protein [Gammaproteobacteria bacterium]MDD9957542.1 PilZ domain-containing protein [Gammaproteobacteria bacterium]
MSALTLKEGNIFSTREILELLNMALLHKWNFSYLSIAKNHVSSKPITLMSIDPANGTFGIDSEIMNSNQASHNSILFRAQCGGMSIVFNAAPATSTGDITTNKSLLECQIRLPDEIRISQQRKAVRVDVSSGKTIPVILCSSENVRVQGAIIDISKTGAKIQLGQEMADKLSDIEYIDALRIRLPGDDIIQCQAQIVGAAFDHDHDVTIVRCQFTDMKAHDLRLLNRLINATIESSDPSTHFAIAS